MSLEFFCRWKILINILKVFLFKDFFLAEVSFPFCYNRCDLTNYDSLYLPDFKMLQSYLDLKGKDPSLNLHIDTFCFLVTCPSLTGNEEWDWVLISNRNELFSYSNKTWLEQKWILKEVAVCDIVSFIFILFMFIIFIIRRMLWVLWLSFIFSELWTDLKIISS